MLMYKIHYRLLVDNDESPHKPNTMYEDIEPSNVLYKIYNLKLNSWYQLTVTAVNTAGEKTATYTFSTYPAGNIKMNILNTTSVISRP